MPCGRIGLWPKRHIDTFKTREPQLQRERHRLDAKYTGNVRCRVLHLLDRRAPLG